MARCHYSYAAPAVRVLAGVPESDDEGKEAGCPGCHYGSSRHRTAEVAVSGQEWREGCGPGWASSCRHLDVRTLETKGQRRREVNSVASACRAGSRHDGGGVVRPSRSANVILTCSGCRRIVITKAAGWRWRWGGRSRDDDGGGDDGDVVLPPTPAARYVDLHAPLGRRLRPKD